MKRREAYRVKAVYVSQLLLTIQLSKLQAFYSNNEETECAGYPAGQKSTQEIRSSYF